MGNNHVDKGTRLANFVIDFVFTGILFAFVVVFIDPMPFEKLVFMGVLFLYYFLCESVFGQTLGKLFTNTKVVDLTGHKPHVGRILLRSLLRLYPFDVMSYLLGPGQGAHDSISKTTLVTVKTK